MKNSNKVSIIVILVVWLWPLYAQPQNTLSGTISAEKIYLQLDNKIYTTHETIWFKAIVLNSRDHTPTKLSGVLYVELIGPNGLVLEIKIIRIKNGIGDGCFKLKSYAEGLYLVRAYTEWNKNFGDEFFFKDYIQVFNPVKHPVNPITNITLTEDQNSGRRISATLVPNTNEAQKELQISLTIDDKKDTLLIRKDKDNKFSLDCSIPYNCQFVTVEILSGNRFNYSKTIIINKNYLDIQFFPESGELVQGLPNVVGFKALDCYGKGKKVEGEIVDSNNKIISYFKSNELGMGYFTLNRVDSCTSYSARLLPYDQKEIQKLHPLPEIVAKGNVLSVKKYGDNILVSASSNYLKNDSIQIYVSCRGILHYNLAGRLKNGNLKVSLPANKLPEGVIALTMLDNLKNPVAERLYFNERPESRVNIAVSTDKNFYLQREKTSLNVKTTNQIGEPINSNISVLVFNKEKHGQKQNIRKSILSYLLLSSDLKGEIENPGFYFIKDSNRCNDLNALMLTQGWRKYKYNKPFDNKIQFQPETNLNVSGTVRGLFSKQKNASLTMMTFGKQPTLQTQSTDSLGRFYFDLDEQYGKNLDILIQSANSSGKRKDYTITLNKKESPAILFKQAPSIKPVDSIVHKLIEQSNERKRIEQAFPLSSGDILLDEVVVEGYRMTPARKITVEKYGMPDKVISGKSIQDREEKWSYGLYSVLLFNFPEVVISTTKNGMLYAKVRRSEITLVVIDGIAVMPHEYPFIPNIPPSEVSSFEIIKDAKNFAKLYSEVVPGSREIPPSGDIIAIYTYAGNGIYGINAPVGSLNTSVPVFSTPCEFYAPKYENLKREDWIRPDLRTLIHWQPKLQTDSLGNASVLFFNADNLGKMQVVIEAISANGEIGYTAVEYEVRKNKGLIGGHAAQPNP